MFPEGFLIADRVGAQLPATSKKRILEEVGQRLSSAVPDLTQDLVFDALLEREHISSTGLGKGIALPHARMPQVTQAVAAFIQLSQAVEFDAVDSKPVDLVFAMLVPNETTDLHLQLLSCLARMFSDEKLCEQLRSSTEQEQLYNLIIKAQSTHCT